MPLLVLRFHSGNRTALFMEREQGKNDIAANQREAETSFEKGGHFSMSAIRLQDAIGEIQDCHIAEAHPEYFLAHRRAKKWMRPKSSELSG